MRSPLHSRTPIALAALLALGAAEVGAQPVTTQLPVRADTGRLINARVEQSGSNMLVTQGAHASNRGLVEWTSFSIGSAASVRFDQPNAQSVMVNRVVGDGRSVNASEIYGRMSGNGRVFLVNPAGVIFGGSAQVNVGSLVATSLDLTSSMTDNNYAGFVDSKDVSLATTRGVSETGPIQVLPAADPATPQIQVSEGGSITLISYDQVRQGGYISAPQGQITLTTATAAQLLPVGNSGFVELVVASPSTAGNTIALETGSKTEAASGSIIIGGDSADKGTRNNTIEIRGSVSADSSAGAAGSVRIDAGPEGTVIMNQAALVSASSSAGAGAGGQASILGRNIFINQGDGANPQVLADGSTGGGRIVVGDSLTRDLRVAQDTLISADATEAGNGGSIALRAMYDNPAATGPVARTDYGVTEVYGTVRARGGEKGGNGGQIETSGMALATRITNSSTGQTRSATVDASARAKDGNAGSWTLDPYDVTISTAGTTSADGNFNPTGTGTNIRAADISAALDAGTNIDISTGAGGAGPDTGDIQIDTGTTITRSTGATPATLTLRANGNITVNSGVAITSAATAGPLNVNLFSDLDGTGGGSILVDSSQIRTNGGNLTLSGGLNPSTGFATGNSDAAGVAVRASTLDTTTSGAAAGNLVIRGAGGGAFNAVELGGASTLSVGNLSVLGTGGNGAGVAFQNLIVNTAAGNIDIRGVGQTDGINTGVSSTDNADFRIGTGSLTLAGRGAGTVGTAGLLINNLRISAAPASTGTITLAGDATGPLPTGGGLGITTNLSATSGLVISSNAETPLSAATGAHVVIGGSSTAAQSALNLSSTTGLSIATTGAINLRPLGVNDISGAITELTTNGITIFPAGSNTPPSDNFALDANWLRAPTATSGGMSAGQGIVIGSAAHTRAITVQSDTFTQHATLALTLQNEGTGSEGITIGGNNTLRTLGLLTAGNVSQATAGITAQNLVIRGGSASTVTLGSATNNFSTVAFDPPSALTVRTSGALTIDALSAPTFTASTGSFAPLAITTSIGGNTALLQSLGTALPGSGTVTVNQSISMTGTGALDIVAPVSVTFSPGATITTSPTGRWRVWAPTVVNAPTTGASTNLYGCVFGDSSNCSVSNALIPLTGNYLLHPTQPTLTITPTPTAGYAGLPTPTLGYTVAGLVNGDSAAAALTGSLATTATPSSAAGSYPISSGSLSSPLGYSITVATGSSLTLALPNLDVLGVSRDMFQSRFRSEMSSDVYGRNLDQPYICTAASVMRGNLGTEGLTDPLASEWGKVRNQPQLSGCLNVTDGGSCSAF